MPDAAALKLQVMETLKQLRLLQQTQTRRTSSHLLQIDARDEETEIGTDVDWEGKPAQA